MSIHHRHQDYNTYSLNLYTSSRSTQALAVMAAEMDPSSKKRKPSTSLEKSSKKPSPQTPSTTTAQDSPLYKPHASILRELAPKYDVLPASVISSTQIRKRLVHITSHLLPTPDQQPPAEEQDRTSTSKKDAKKARAVLLYARPGEVCKMITVAETCKRLLEEQGQASWWQYNQLFDLPAEDAQRARQSRRRKRVVEETVLHVDEDDEKAEEEEEDSESDAFETMQTRFEKAVLPPPSERRTKSLRIFLSTTAMVELKTREGVTVQSSGK